MKLLIYHIIAFSIGILLDCIVGDPYWMPHPIRFIGQLIGKLDQRYMSPLMENRNVKKEKKLGLLTVAIVLGVTGACGIVLLAGAYIIHPYLGIVVEAILTCYCLAARSLKTESMKVYKALQTKDIDASRYAVSMIVGRDTKCLDETGVAKACIETVAENTSDGVIAPLLYTCLGGPVAGLLYKAVNTMDSMIGYHNDRYENFGAKAAKLDDIVNYLPARMSAWFMIMAAALSGNDYNAKESKRIFLRDRYQHKSPNSAQTESACAGALGIRLAGDASYFGKIVKKPYIGDDTRKVSSEDIKRANHLMYATAAIAVTICELFLMIAVIVERIV